MAGWKRFADFLALFTPSNMLVWFIGMSVGLFMGLFLFFSDAAKPSVVVEALRENDGTVVRGGSLDIVTTVRKTKNCPRKVERWLWRCMEGSTLCNPADAEPNEAQWIPILAPGSPPIPMGDHVRYMISLPLPANVEPGDWYFTGRGRDECSWLAGVFGPVLRYSPHALVHVLDPTADHPATVTAPPGPVTVLPEQVH